MKNKEKNNFIKNIFIKTEKINSLFLFLIVVIIFTVSIILQACVLPKNDYKSEPNYEEVKYYDWVNPYVRVFTSYVEESEKITPKYRVIACFFGNTSANRIVDFKGDFLFITEENEYIYKGDTTLSTSSAYSNTEYYLNNESVKGGFIDKIYGKLSYTRYENNEKTKEEFITFKEEILSLSKKEKNMEVCNQFSDISDIVESYNITLKKDEDKNTIYSKLKTSSDSKLKYHIDFQLFGLDNEGEVYNLVGYYNLANNYKHEQNDETTIASKVNLEYVIVKCRVLDEQNGERVVYLKKAFKDIAVE